MVYRATCVSIGRGKILNNEDIVIIGDKMRKDRNLDLYSADITITQTEADSSLKFVEELFLKI